LQCDQEEATKAQVRYFTAALFVVFALTFSI